ncbi:transposase [bacterium]|nr:transposase [bacterium]
MRPGNASHQPRPLSKNEHRTRLRRSAADRHQPLDVPAELISQLYRHRWLIELFFRMFKQLLGCRHLLSTKHNGVEIQAYCAIIACLLILIHAGRTPTKRTFEMICFSLSGWASFDELERHIAKRQPPPH